MFPIVMGCWDAACGDYNEFYFIYVIFEFINFINT